MRPLKTTPGRRRQAVGVGQPSITATASVSVVADRIDALARRAALLLLEPPQPVRTRMRARRRAARAARRATCRRSPTTASDRGRDRAPRRRTMPGSGLRQRQSTRSSSIERRRMMRAVIPAVEMGAAARRAAGDRRVQLADELAVGSACGDAALVGDDDQRVAGALEAAAARRRSTDTASRCDSSRQIADVVVHRAVAIEEHRRASARRREAEGRSGQRTLVMESARTPARPRRRACTGDRSGTRAAYTAGTRRRG